METEDYLAKRANHASRKTFEAALAQVADRNLTSMIDSESERRVVAD